MGFVNRKAVKRPFLTRLHIRARSKFAQKFKRWDVAKWSKVVFSDEKLFRTRPGRVVRCWRPKSGNKFSAKYVNQAQQQPESLMVWAAINGKGKLSLRRCPKKVKSADYQDILKSALRFIRPRCLFVE